MIASYILFFSQLLYTFIDFFIICTYVVFIYFLNILGLETGMDRDIPTNPDRKLLVLKIDGFILKKNQ